MSKNNLIKNVLGQRRIPTPYRTMLIEAQEKAFTFRLYRGDETYNAAADAVEMLDDKLNLTIEDTIYSIRYADLFEVQILPKSKTVNLIPIEPFGAKRALMFSPGIIASIMLVFNEQLSKLFGVSSDLVFGVGASFLFFVMLNSIITVSSRREQLRMQAVSTGRTTTGIKRLETAANEEEYFSRLIEVNLRNIEDFNALVKRQSNNSFKITAWIAIAGFLVLLFGIILSLIPSVKTPSGALTIGSGLLVEFISAIFFYLYNRTIDQLNKFHRELIDVQNTMLALKVSQGIVDDQALKNQTMRYLTETLTGPQKNKQEDTTVKAAYHRI